MTLMRTCTKCFLQKPIEEFGWKDRTINKRHAVCKECTAKRSSEWYYKNREHHIQSVAENSKSYRAQAGEYIYQYLLAHPCVDCGETDPVVLEFHHLGDKSDDVASMVGEATHLKRSKPRLISVKCSAATATNEGRLVKGDGSGVGVKRIANKYPWCGSNAQPAD